MIPELILYFENYESEMNSELIRDTPECIESVSGEILAARTASIVRYEGLGFVLFFPLFVIFAEKKKLSYIF